MLIQKKVLLTVAIFQQQQTAWNGVFQAVQLYEKNSELMFFLNQMTEFITDISGNDGMTDKKRFNMALSINQRCLFGNSVNKLELKEVVNPKYILAIINSNVIDWYFRKTSTNNHVNIYELEQLPIPTATTEQQKQIINLVDQILSLKNNNSSADTSTLELGIDSLVYQLYGLTEDEINIVEQS